MELQIAEEPVEQVVYEALEALAGVLVLQNRSETLDGEG